MKYLNLELERLEQRIAPGSICCDGGSKDDGCDGGSKKGNNGFGNGGDDPAPGNSGSTGHQKPEDVVR